MDNIPDPFAKTVHVPVRIVKGKILHSGKELALKDGTSGTLVLYASALLDEGLRKQLSEETTAELLPKATELMVDVNPRSTSHGERDRLHNDSRLGHIQVSGHFHIALLLEGPLLLQRKGTKKPSLLPCPIKIPALDGQFVESVNEAYTVVSRFYETHRRSHSGNVFEKVLFFDKDAWRPLDLLRDRVERVQEAGMAQMKLRI